jgi:hypothetical protein
MGGNRLSIGHHRPIYLWAGPGTIRMNRLKFMGAPVDERAHLEAYAEEGAYRVASELGCNWAYLTYNWGFPPEIEKEDWIVFQQASQIYHQHGIRVFAYIQTSNAVFEGSYRARDWYAWDPTGRPIYYYTGRYMTCWLHPEWQAHLRERIRDAIRSGADGIFFDNPWHGAQPLYIGGRWLGPAGCYCPRCRATFRQAWGLEIPRRMDPQRDEGSRLYLRWRAQTVSRVLAALAEEARSLKPDIVISANDFDAVMRPSFLIYGIDLASLSRIQDILMIESYGLPRWDGVRLVNNAVTVRTARALAGNTPISTIAYDRGIGFDEVYPPRRFQQSMAEAIACGAIPVIKGTEFVSRGMFTVLTAPDYARERKAIGDYHRWLAEHVDLFAGRENAAPVALLYPGDALWIEWPQIAPLYFGVAQTLLAAGIPWRVVRSSEEAADAAVLISVESLSQATGFPGRYVVLRELPEWRGGIRGGVTFSSSMAALWEGFLLRLYRSYFRSRWTRRWIDRLGLVHFFLQSPYFQLPSASARERLLAMIGPIFPRVAAAQPVLIEVWRRGSEEQIHLVNYAEAPQEITLYFEGPRRGVRLSPDEPTTTFEGSQLTFVLDVYVILVSELAKR